ncbi:peroxin-1 [Strigomonas culicis]|nr:peroxin-1 [Strigomonas culicis]|eukprot:EPY20836.1 peroxin-1 [Strigomonas culicis]
MLVLPRPEDVVTVTASANRGEGGATRAPTRADGHVPEAALPTLEELDAVHEAVPSELLARVQFALERGQGDNILFSGAKGYGKTAVVQRVLRRAQRSAVAAHTLYVDCVESKALLPELKRCMQECLLCAPAVLVLDNFDRIAPSQAEGQAQSISDQTQAELELLLSMSRRTVALVGGAAGIVVLATCANRDAVHEYFRSAHLFPVQLTLGPLTRVTRTALVQQLLPQLAPEEHAGVVSFMENFTAFDTIHFVNRVKDVYYQKKRTIPAKECAAQCAEGYKPIAHAGIKFLKGEKLVWESIGGLVEAKKVLYDTLVLPMHHPQLFARLPLKTRSGLLLYGPSGCGKTFVVESIVNAQNLNCIVVNGPEVFGKYIGQSEQKIRDIFERAQAAAPCVIFFDEFESVAPQRGADNSGVTDRVVNQLLCYMDGVEGRKDVYVVAASSRPDLIDAALLRPGRLDKAVCCPVPTERDRAAILRFLLDNVEADVTEADVAQIAAQTDQWTPADLSAVVATANTLVSQRIVEELTRAARDHETAASEASEALFLIADVGEGTTRDKVAGSLDYLKQKTTATLTARQQEERITVADVRAAMATTRPSLTPADIAKHERIHKLFSKGETPQPPVPGTKVITA